MKIFLENEQQTEQLGAELWRVLPDSCLVFLSGELGAGKTCLTRSVLRAAGYMGAVKSPTYTLVETYEIGDRKFFHFDLYRLRDPEELEWIGIRDYFQQQALCFIEWSALGAGFLPLADLEISFHLEPDGRSVKLTTISDKLKNKLILQWNNKDIVL